MLWERRKFLIVVKTYPNPSAGLQEVVCTAAIRDDGKLVRLFPIPYRTMAEAGRFRKWQWVEAAVTKARNDGRAESYQVDATTIKLLDFMDPGLKGWPARWKHVDGLISPSLEALKRTSASLGIIKPAEFDLTFEDEEDPQWTLEQRSKLAGAEGAIALFGKSPPTVALLEKLPVKISYRYRCADEECTGHKQLFEDWEVGESWRSWRRRYKDRSVLEEKLRERYVHIPKAKGNLFLFVGTHSRYPDIWLVIGHAQPDPRVLASGSIAG